MSLAKSFRVERVNYVIAERSVCSSLIFECLRIRWVSKCKRCSCSMAEVSDAAGHSRVQRVNGLDVCIASRILRTYLCTMHGTLLLSRGTLCIALWNCSSVYFVSCTSYRALSITRNIIQCAMYKVQNQLHIRGTQCSIYIRATVHRASQDAQHWTHYISCV